MVTHSINLYEDGMLNSNGNYQPVTSRTLNTSQGYSSSLHATRILNFQVLFVFLARRGGGRDVRALRVEEDISLASRHVLDGTQLESCIVAVYPES